MLVFLLYVSGAYPLLLALHANRRTSLLHALFWTLAAWMLWGTVLLGRVLNWSADTDLRARYLALVLTGCAGVAVLGARRPGVAAWNFVVLGLLAVLMLPLAQGWLLGTPLQLGELYLLCLAGNLMVTVLNHLPTRLLPAALLLGVVCAWELAAVRANLDPPWSRWPCPALALVPWLAWIAFRFHAVSLTAPDALWLSFRDRFGFLWAQRVREQFNNSMQHAGLGVRLRWSGLDWPEQSAEVVGQVDAILRALLKRFLESDFKDVG